MWGTSRPHSAARDAGVLPAITGSRHGSHAAAHRTRRPARPEADVALLMTAAVAHRAGLAVVGAARARAIPAGPPAGPHALPAIHLARSPAADAALVSRAARRAREI